MALLGVDPTVVRPARFNCGAFTFDWTIEHYESGVCIMQNDCELDCEYRSGHVHILGGRFNDSAKPVEFSDIKNGNLERFIDMKMIEIENDQNFQHRAAQYWEDQQ